MSLYDDEPTYLGDYDDICAQCGAEQSIAVHTGVKNWWYCRWCKNKNKVAESE